ncbi:MAG: MFS transporter [Candidatus Levybacteria bacterium]|nr:MFS transporter [Candidatus Levybacteria bacterium]
MINKFRKLSENRNLAIIALIAVVNALGYGIIIPILYSYSTKFGMSDFENGLLFAVFSLCSFIANPIIGRLSDKYGRKPLLVISISGTALSFLIAAFAPSAIFLFIARALDGFTAGNIPVASAVISDTTPLKDRAKGFGIIGASFGFGFVFGPAISALTVGFGLHVPFLIAAGISLVAVLLTFFFLPETNRHIGKVKNAKIFDFKKMVTAVVDPKVGLTLLISLVYNIALGMFIFAFQPFSVKVLGMSPNQIATVFTLFGIIGLVTQIFILQRVVKFFGEKKAFTFALLLSSITYLAIFFTKEINIFLVITVASGLANSFIGPLTQTILSRETDEKSQGSIQGLNASYISVGNILGPVIAGVLATVFLPLPFLVSSFIILSCFFLSFGIMKKGASKEHAF